MHDYGLGLKGENIPSFKAHDLLLIEMRLLGLRDVSNSEIFA